MGLETQHGGKTQATLATEAIVQEEGRYIYCVADAGEKLSLGRIGIEGHEVYAIPYRDICAVVHNCPTQPYQSDDQEVVKAWVMTHQKVVDAAWERWGTVLPLSFDTIIREEAEESAEQNVKDWLKQEYERLESQIGEVRGKAEYGVQVFWNPKLVAQNLTQTSPDIRNLEEEIKTKPKGLAYMYRQKLENLIKHAMEAAADEYFKNFYSRIRKHVDDVRVEKTKKVDPGLQMIMNLSCLVYRDRYTELGEELDKINRMEGFLVRFTGPWPPYSFVGGA
jgi:hypothetical protein